MRISFVLPAWTPAPVGGFKVVYEYANRLAARGHDVVVTHPLHCPAPSSPAQHLHTALWLRAQRRRGMSVDWFPLEPAVDIRVVPTLHPRQLPTADATVATSWRTADPVARLERTGRRYYLLQHHEIWDGDRAAVDATWRLPLRKIVIARWLQALCQRLAGEHAAYIPNGLDFDHLRLQRAPNDRDPARVGMLYHPAAWKGTGDGLVALRLARMQVPRLSAVLFGTDPPPPGLPRWIEYLRQPSPEALVRLYNDIAVFVHPSHAEGWPLPPAEAMACGAALLAAGNDGVLDYAEPGRTAAVTPVGDAPQMAARLVELLRNPGDRAAMALRGTAAIRSFTWSRAVEAMEPVLSGEVVDGR